jgi:transposase-like protein
MKAMHQGDFKLSGRVDVDESSVGGKEPGRRGRSKGKKKEFVIGVQMLKKKIVRVFAHQIKNASSKELKPFFEQRVSSDAHVRVDKWRAYNPIKRSYPNMIQERSKPEKNFKLLHREIMMLKAALRGIYHHMTHLQDYLNEYFFRKNINDKSQLFHTVIYNMILSKPIPINQLNLG